MIAVYYRRRNRDWANRVIERVKQSGEAVRPANAEYFDPDQLEPVDSVYHDGTEPAIPAAYGAIGVECRAMGRDEPPSPAEGDTGTDGYTVEQNGTWFTLYDPDGDKVGSSQRSEDEAWALMEGDDADG